jgi:hypothetical protein
LSELEQVTTLVRKSSVSCTAAVYTAAVVEEAKHGSGVAGTGEMGRRSLAGGWAGLRVGTWRVDGEDGGWHERLHPVEEMVLGDTIEGGQEGVQVVYSQTLHRVWVVGGLEAGRLVLPAFLSVVHTPKKASGIVFSPAPAHL